MSNQPTHPTKPVLTPWRVSLAMGVVIALIVLAKEPIRRVLEEQLGVTGEWPVYFVSLAAVVVMAVIVGLNGRRLYPRRDEAPGPGSESNVL